jgi:histidinol-phosphatase
METLRTYLDAATEMAWLAGRLTLGYFQTGLRADMKADETPVTAADRAAEQLIRQMLADRFPDHAILGEEYGGTAANDAPYRWIIDPIDGTRAFARGVPMYAVLIGLEIEGRAEVGAACFPALGEIIVAARGEGCWWNGRRAQASAVKTLKEGLLVHADTASFAKQGRGEAWTRLQQAAGFRAGWSDAYGYLLVATGRAELMLDPIMNVWDCAPLLPILQEAGGYFGDWQGNPTIHGGEALATTAVLLPEVLRLIKG